MHALDARAKLVTSLLLAGAAVLAGTLRAQLVLLAVLLGAFALARLGPALLWRGLRGALWLLAFVAFANTTWAWVARHASWAGGEGTVQSPADLALLVLRLFNLLVLAGVVTATTVPVDAAEGLERLLRPLRRAHLPVHELGLLLVLALSFVPIFLREAERLTDAHRMKMGRGRWNALDRARAAVPLLVPLFLSVLRRADELAVALDARCFVPGAPRTALVAGRLGAAELLAVLVGGAALLACSRA